MSNLSSEENVPTANPLDIVEQFIEINDWIFDRRSDYEMAVQVPGTWCDYSLYFAWNEEKQALHFTCAFDIRITPNQKKHISELLMLINEKLWLGNFCIWEEEGLPLFRHALPLRGTQGATIQQMEDLVLDALNECERFHPAFQYLIWGGKLPKRAIELAIIETVGES